MFVFGKMFDIMNKSNKTEYTNAINPNVQPPFLF